MKNNLSKIYLKIIKMILTIILVISSLIMYSKVIALSEINLEKSMKVGAAEASSISNQNNVDKYLFIGNSKTYYNNFPFMFQKFMKDSGKNVIVREVTRGGHTLTRLWEKDYIKKECENEYDYVVLQPRILDSESGEQQAAVDIVTELKKHNSNIKVIINGVWKNGDKYKANTKAQNIMDKRFRELKDVIKKECGVDVKISYWGDAVLRAMYSNSIGINELFTDDRHPTVLNSYLGVASLYSTITGKESNCEYNGTVNNNQYSSIGKYDLNNWNYLADLDRWKNDTEGIDRANLMKSIAYKTHLAQQNDEADKLDVIFKLDNSPRIKIEKQEEDKDKGVNVVITDYNGLKPENVKIYKSDEKTEITNYTIKKEPEIGKTTRLIYSFDKNFFNKNDKEIYVVAKDNNENYNKSTFSIKRVSDNKYSVDAAPRLRGFDLDNKEKKINFKVADRGGIKYLKVYDLNQKDKDGNFILVKQIENIEGSKVGTLVEIDLKDLKEKDNIDNKEKEDTEDKKTHYYSIKVVAKDVTGRKCKRIINYKITDK